MKIALWDRRKCQSYRGVRLTVVRLKEVFLWERLLSSAGTSESVPPREVSVLWDVLLNLKRFYCTMSTFYEPFLAASLVY